MVEDSSLHRISKLIFQRWYIQPLPNMGRRDVRCVICSFGKKYYPFQSISIRD